MAPRRLSREESRARTRERLLAAATELFAERGIGGTSVEQIAERAGFSRGAFYGNFGGKHDLVLALLQRRTEQEFQEVRALGDASRDPQDTFERLRSWHRDRAGHLTQWMALRAELWLYALRDEEVRRRMAEREEFARRAHQSGIEDQLARRGARAPADTAFLALITHALEDGLLIQHLLTPDRVPPEAVVDAVELLMDTWAAHGTTPGPRPEPPEEETR